MVPVHSDYKHLLGINWNGQVAILTLHSHLVHAVIFTALADGLQWVLQQWGVSYVTHYLDDFITLGPSNSDQCFKNLHIIIKTCKGSGIPLAPHKSVGLTTCWYRNRYCHKGACTREALEFLLGQLNHACSVVSPGGSFIGRLNQLLTEAKHKHQDFIRINKEARSDIRWWHTFIESWNGVSILRQHNRAHPDHKMWTDTARSLGAGAFWKSEWFQLKS